MPTEVEKNYFGPDSRGRTLCRNCWDGFHYSWEEGAKGQKQNKRSNCLQGVCECECVAMLLETHPRIRRDDSAQISIVEVGGTIDIKPEPL